MPGLAEHIPNFAEDSPFVEYFHARHMLAYRSSLKSADRRRDATPLVIAALEAYLNAVSDPRKEALLDALVQRDTDASEPTAADPIARARRENPRGVDLLVTTRPATFESLKSDYRRAALRHHPDRGGSHEDFIAINDAYNELQALIDLTPDLPQGRAASGRGFTCNALTSLVNYAEDLHDLDLALGWIRRGDDRGWLGHEHGFAYDWQAYNSHNFSLLTKKLILAGRHDDAEYVARVGARHRSVGRNAIRGEGHWLDDLAPFFSGEKKTSVPINHPLQAANARAHRLVPEKRLAAAEAKFADERRAQGKNRLEFERRTQGRGLLRLSVDEDAYRQPPPPKFVPETRYFSYDIDALTPEQQAEYAANFGPTPSWDVTYKYQFIRIRSLLVTLQQGTVTPESLLEEAEIMRDCQDPKRYRKEWDAIVSHLSAVVRTRGEDRQRLIDSAFDALGRHGALYSGGSDGAVTFTIDLNDLDE